MILMNKKQILHKYHNATSRDEKTMKEIKFGKYKIETV